jgi:hypothetical protein
MGGTIAEARRSLGCMGCKLHECSGPVLLEEITSPAPQKTKTPPPLKEWREGVPPQGRYILDLDAGEMREVNVGHGIFELDGKVHPISFAFEVGILRGPIPKKAKEEKKVKNIKPAVVHDIPGLTPEADAAIRLALRTLADTPGYKRGSTIAPQLLAAYGEDLRAVRKQHHGWQRIARVFRAQGLHIAERTLKAGLEEN